MITEVDANYAESVTRLVEALGHIQFQDVMRQRMEHVQQALEQMRDHLIRLAMPPIVPAGTSNSKPTSNHCLKLISANTRWPARQLLISPWPEEVTATIAAQLLNCSDSS